MLKLGAEIVAWKFLGVLTMSVIPTRAVWVIQRNDAFGGRRLSRDCMNLAAYYGYNVTIFFALHFSSIGILNTWKGLAVLVTALKKNILRAQEAL